MPEPEPEPAADEVAEGAEIAEVAERHGVPAVLVELVAELASSVQVGRLNGEIPTVEAAIERSEGTWTLQASLYGEGSVLVVLSVLDEPVPAERRDAVAGLLEALNWALVLGNTEIEPGGATVRFRTGLFLAGADLSAHQAAAVVRANLGTAALVFPAVRAVATGTTTAEEAAAALSAHLEEHGVDLGT